MGTVITTPYDYERVRLVACMVLNLKATPLPSRKETWRNDARCLEPLHRTSQKTGMHANAGRVWLERVPFGLCTSRHTPRRSKYPKFKDSDPKNHALNGFWDQSP